MTNPGQRSDANNSAAHLAECLNLPLFIAKILCGRGYSNVEDARQFLDPSLDVDWASPYDIEGMKDVVEVLSSALDGRKKIVVFGDFDVDGITATCIMTQALRVLGGQATPIIPKRFDEGYGLTPPAVDRICLYDPDLVVTVDCGISCAAEVEMLKARGIEVAITDHHEPGTSVPQGVALCDPKTVPCHPQSILAGAGVALKVIQALGSRHGYPYLWRDYIDLATLGTIADIMPMRGDNRALVSAGLKVLNDRPRPCISAMIAVCGKKYLPFTSTNLSFSLIPRLNSAGRMGREDIALDLLMSDSFDSALPLAGNLEETNNLRRQVEAELATCAFAKADETYRGERVLVAAGHGWAEGVKGIVAAKLVGKYHVPSILFTIDGEEARGSGRSCGSVNLYEAVSSVSDLLTRYGGHAAAVGVTLPAERLEEFSLRLNDYMDRLPEESFVSEIRPDVAVSLGELDLQSVEAISLLAPFGEQNREPVLLAKNVFIDSPRAVGAERSHLSCRITDGKTGLSAIMFSCPCIDECLGANPLTDVLFSAQPEEWAGRRYVKALLKKVRIISRSDGNTEGLGYARTDVACDPVLEVIRQNTEGRLSAPAHASVCARRGDISLDEIVEGLIGTRQLHESQAEILDALRQDISTLAIMATGRGKSLTFQAHAVYLALSRGSQSIFVYPLRALMADQGYALGRKLSKFGISSETLYGETPQDRRQEIYESLAGGDIDIILTTPEFLCIHADKFAKYGRIGFVAIDEAHHISQATSTNRPMYKKLGAVLDILGQPVVLALTATADEVSAQTIKETLRISHEVIDRASRPNLHIDDARGIRARDDYLAHIAAGGEKCVIYVNSRTQTVDVARRLRARLGHIATQIGYYNAGLSQDVRRQAEDMFRSSRLSCLVATSAFGEGIDIPDIRHIAIYHVPFSDVEFNQMSGRAGRDGTDSFVHLLYGRQDAFLNRKILEAVSPPYDVMALIYRILRRMAADSGNAPFAYDREAIIDACGRQAASIEPATLDGVISVFCELGLLRMTEDYNTGPTDGQGKAVLDKIYLVTDAVHVELTDSPRYSEGLSQISAFEKFSSWAFSADVPTLERKIQNPIAPPA